MGEQNASRGLCPHNFYYRVKGAAWIRTEETCSPDVTAEYWLRGGGEQTDVAAQWAASCCSSHSMCSALLISFRTKIQETFSTFTLVPFSDSYLDFSIQGFCSCMCLSTSNIAGLHVVTQPNLLTVKCWMKSFHPSFHFVGSAWFPEVARFLLLGYAFIFLLPAVPENLLNGTFLFLNGGWCSNLLCLACSKK